MQSSNNNSPTFSLPNILLRLEGLVVFIVAIMLFRQQGGAWWLFALLLLSPDVAMVGYFANLQAGAWVYNIVHAWVIPVIVVLVGVSIGNPTVTQLGLIWVAHIGMDRVAGYGLKYTTAFKDTHLQRV
ncbi:MAG: DUF4260 domain-containing protein [Phototrophicaceae bacterium]|jgi:hypothetical protein